MKDQLNGHDPRRARFRDLRHASCLTLAVREAASTLHLRVTGELDLSGVGVVENALARLDEPSAPRRVVFDLSDLQFLDAAGLRTLLRADARGRADSFDVRVVPPHGTASRVFTLTRAGDRLKLVDDPDAP
jgi:anti-anti-sigma factor